MPRGRSAVLLVMAWAALATGIAISPVSGTGLRTLCNVAIVSDRLRELQPMVRAAEEQQAARETLKLLAARVEHESKALVSSLATMSELHGDDDRLSQDGQNDAAEIGWLTSEAVRLHTLLEEQQQQITLLEAEASGSASRAREVFDLLDVNEDGILSLDEFQEAASTLFSGVSENMLKATMKARFDSADVDSDGNLDFDEFAAMLASMRGDALPPLREARAVGLANLLDVTLKLTSHNLARELISTCSATTTPGGRVTTLSSCVERWCEIDAQATATAARLTERDGAVSYVGRASEYEVLLSSVRHLATDLSLDNLNSTEWSILRMQRMARQAVVGLRTTLAFCWRGLRIMAADLRVVLAVGRQFFTGAKINDKDVKHVGRTLVDLIALVPYTIIMLIPLSPPGHVFVFSLLNRAFPAAVPSAFTQQRQDVDVIYSQIAAEAARDSRSYSSLLAGGATKRLRTASLRIWRAVTKRPPSR